MVVSIFYAEGVFFVKYEYVEKMHEASVVDHWEIPNDNDMPLVALDRFVDAVGAANDAREQDMRRPLSSRDVKRIWNFYKLKVLTI